MRKRPGTLHKLLSFSRWQRRFGARMLPIAITEHDDLEELKVRAIDEGEFKLSRGSAKDIQQHYVTLRKEFSGQPELCFHHAMLIVMIRREVSVAVTFDRFESLWHKHGDWLLKHLNIRWLVSACDTFADHSTNAAEKSLALATTLLANTVKAYETENILSNHTTIQYNPQVVAKLQQEAIPLIEGMSCYTIGTDDTLRNMVWRMKDIAPTHTTGRILIEVFQRLCTSPTAFCRMRLSHTRTKTQFWD
jgi:hypothetical protein